MYVSSFCTALPYFHFGATKNIWRDTIMLYVSISATTDSESSGGDVHSAKRNEHHPVPPQNDFGTADAVDHKICFASEENGGYYFIFYSERVHQKTSGRR